MSENIVKGLAIFGGGVIALFVWLFLLTIWDWLRNQINMAKYRYKRKHRFDRDPTAECYCKDCVQYTSYDEYCHKFRRCVNDDEFCKWASPHKRDPEKKKGDV